MAPSITECGSCSKISRSLQVPGSLSSPLQSTYFGLADCLGTNDHFIPVLNPAPPRPRRPEFLTSLIRSSGFIPAPSARLCSRPVRDSGRCGRALAKALRDHAHLVGMGNQSCHFARCNRVMAIESPRFPRIPNSNSTAFPSSYTRPKPDPTSRSSDSRENRSSPAPPEPSCRRQCIRLLRAKTGRLAVVPLWPMPSFFLQWSSSSSPPRSMHAILVHTCTLYLPRGLVVSIE
jgi:hypothetical protein